MNDREEYDIVRKAAKKEVLSYQRALFKSKYSAV